MTTELGSHLVATSLARNRINGRTEEGAGAETRVIRNPADQREIVASVREASAAQVDAACEAAAAAFTTWRVVPPPKRVQVLFSFRELLERNVNRLAELLVRENGKLFSEALGDVRRGIDSVEFACGIPSLLMGRTLPDVSREADSYVLREPLGVVAGIPPFNFPAMIPLWMMPIAIACGNAFVLKAAEKAPLTAALIAELFDEAGLPAGVLNVIHGGSTVGKRLIEHRAVSAVSFVGSTAAAEQVYRTAAHAGKRVQALGGAKNHLIVLPDADLKRSIPALIGSAFGCAGQRCLAGSVLIVTGNRARQDAAVDAFASGASALRLGGGMDERATLCPLQSAEHRARVADWIGIGLSEGAKLVLDGRTATVPELPHGCCIGPSIFDDAIPEMRIAREEIFGPVVTVLRAGDLTEAIDIANRSDYGNSASLFTQDGAAVRTFRQRIQCGMLGINLGVPAPMAMFSFGGWKRSLFGDLHAHGPDAVDFYTRKKVVTERWFGAEAPQQGWI